MPTGYTAEILDGKVTTATEFAAKCARAFMVNMRDEPWDSSLVMPKRYDSYYAEELPARLAELAEWDNSTEEEKYARWSEYAVKQSEAAEEAKQRAEENYQKLQAVLVEVRRIKVPESHFEFRNFMIDQINQTIDFDGTFNEKYYQVQDYVSWVEEHRGHVLRSIRIASEGLEKSEQNYQKGREWVSTLANLYDLEIVDE